MYPEAHNDAPRAQARIAEGKPMGESPRLVYQQSFPYHYHTEPVYLDPYPHAGSLRCAVTILGVLGILQIASIQGLLAVGCMCYAGCCCGSRKQVVRASSCLKCTAFIAVILSCVYCAAAVVVTQRVCDRLCGLIVLDVTQPTQAQDYQRYSQMLVNAVDAYRSNTTAASYDNGESGKSRWLLVHPWEVCETLHQPEVAAHGVFFPHPLSSFGRSIEIYLLAVNGATAVVGTMVIFLSRKVLNAQMTAPVERVSMHVLAP